MLRKEDARFLRGEGRYVENLPLEGALAITFVRSQLAHAHITVDASAAKEQPGVVQVVTGADVDLGPLDPPSVRGMSEAMGRPMVAQEVVRFVGEIVAIDTPRGGLTVRVTMRALTSDVPAALGADQ